MTKIIKIKIIQIIKDFINTANLSVKFSLVKNTRKFGLIHYILLPFDYSIISLLLFGYTHFTFIFTQFAH